jgi:integrase/recombinase XerD
MLTFVEQWLANYQGKTYQSYHNTIRKFCAAVPLSIEQIQTSHVRNWLNSLDVSDTTRVKHLNHLKAFFNYVVELDQPPIPKQFKLPIPQQTLVERILSKDEVAALLDNELDQRNKLILTTLYKTGVRVSELCDLRWKHFIPRTDLGTYQLTVYGKGGKTRQITLPPVLAQSLQEWRGNASSSSPVFASASGRALAPAHIHRIVKRAAVRAELPQAEKVSPHWLRHAHATHALENHALIALVQATLGHVSLETTSKYLHIRTSQSSGDFL